MVYGVKAPLVVEFVKKPPGKAPNGETVDTPFYEVKYDFVLDSKQAALAARGIASREWKRLPHSPLAIRARGNPMQRTPPPFRADHVGSLLRPAALKDAREKREQGEISAAALTAIEDREIKA